MEDNQITVNVEQMTEAGENLKTAKVGKFLVMVVDTTQAGHPSSSGKMNLIGGSGGWQNVPGGLSINVNIGKKAR